MNKVANALAPNKMYSLLKMCIVILTVFVTFTAVFFGMTFFLKNIHETVATFIASNAVVGTSCFVYGLALIIFQKHSLKEAVQEMIVRIRPLVVATILMTFFILFGYILLFIPGIIANCLLVFTPFVVVVEKKVSFAALKRSCKLCMLVLVPLICAIVGCYVLFLLMTALCSFALEQPFAEIVGGTIVFPVELYVFYRLFERSQKKESGGMENG